MHSEAQKIMVGIWNGHFIFYGITDRLPDKVIYILDTI